MKTISTVLAGATLALASIGAYAQSASTPRIDEREAHQHSASGKASPRAA